MGQDEGQEKTLEVKHPLNNSETLVGYWAAHGWEVKKIAKELDFAESTIRGILRDKRVQLFIKKVKFKIYGEDPALHIKECAAKGIDVAEEIMMNKKNKAHIRQEVAFKFMDRAYGKPGVELNLGEGTVRKLLSIISGQNPVDTPIPEANNVIEDAQYKEIPAESEQPKEIKEADKIDEWLDNNFK